MDVYLDKIGASESSEQNEAMYWGTKLERVIAERWQEEHPENWLDYNEDHRIARSETHPFALATYDGEVWQNWPDGHGGFEHGLHAIAGWEAKTASAYKRSEWDGSTPPLEYVYQCQWCMFVSGHESWFLSVLIGGNDYREWLIERDEDIIEMLVGAASNFWKMVEDGTPPAIDGSEASKRVLNTLYPASEVEDDEPVVLAEAESLASRYVAAKAALAEAERTLTTIENELKSQMGPHAVGLAGRYQLTWKPRKRTSFDSKRFMEANPTFFYEPFIRTSEYRVFGVKEVDGDD